MHCSIVFCTNKLQHHHVIIHTKTFFQKQLSSITHLDEASQSSKRAWTVTSNLSLLPHSVPLLVSYSTSWLALVRISCVLKLSRKNKNKIHDWDKGNQFFDRSCCYRNASGQARGCIVCLSISVCLYRCRVVSSHYTISLTNHIVLPKSLNVLCTAK